MILDLEHNILVKACNINKKQFIYECPSCWVLKNGKVVDSPINKKTKKMYVSAKPGKHCHGSDGDFKNRIEHRISHCQFELTKGVYIEINDDTKKDY